MADIKRYDPFADAFPDVFRGFFAPMKLAADQPLDFKIDVSERDKDYLVRAEIPGVKKEDINVSIDGNQVSISAEVKKETEEKSEKTLRRERYYGNVFRSFSLQHDVDQSNAQAKYQDGILQLTLPKKAEANTKRLAIQ
jgi:HSP20 family protein